MSDWPATRHSLILRIRDTQDSEAWAQFVDVYAPPVYGFVRRRGLQDADAADVTQDVLQAVARAAKRGDYDPGRGPFRGWLFTVVRNKLRNFLVSRRRHCQASGDSDDRNLLESLPERENEDAAQWDYAVRQRLFRWAAEQARASFAESSWQAFWCTAVDGKPAKDVAAELGMSVGAVYVSKSRVLAPVKGLHPSPTAR